MYVQNEMLQQENKPIKEKSLNSVILGSSGNFHLGAILKCIISKLLISDPPLPHSLFLFVLADNSPFILLFVRKISIFCTPSLNQENHDSK